MWTDHNFPNSDWHDPLMGITEEVGELNHALLKQRQGIRGDYNTHEEHAQDAVGDIVIYLIDLCNKRRWNFNKILDDTWNNIVAKRDWQSNPTTGVSVEEAIIANENLAAKLEDMKYCDVGMCSSCDARREHSTYAEIRVCGRKQRMVAQ